MGVFCGIHKIGGGIAGTLCFFGYIVHQIVDVQNIAAGKNAGHGSLTAVIHQCTSGDGIHRNPGTAGQLVFRNQTHGKKQCVAGNVAAGFWQNLPVFVHLGDGDAFYTLCAVNLRHGGA